jgi:hypothetical protein
MMTNYPITPPPAILQQLRSKAPTSGWFRDAWIAEQAAQWGADQELEACCAWLDKGFGDVGNFPATLRAARRPRPTPPSLKEQALETLKYPKDFWSEAEVDTIRLALEQLDD